MGIFDFFKKKEREKFTEEELKTIEHYRKLIHGKNEDITGKPTSENVKLPGIDITDMIKDSLNEKPEQETVFDEMKLMTKNLEVKQGEDYKMEKWEYDNGQTKEIGCSLNYQKVGLWRLYHKNGQIKIETFFNKEGIREGNYKNFYENGQIKEDSEYTDDEMISQKCWDEDGNETKCE